MWPGARCEENNQRSWKIRRENRPKNDLHKTELYLQAKSVLTLYERLHGKSDLSNK